MIEVGEIVQGKLDQYRLDALLVRGRFGGTFEAERVRDGREVIVKTVERVDGEALNVDAFERQAERLRRLNHPHIATYLDDAQVVRGGEVVALALVQERMEGDTLQSIIDGARYMDEEALRQVFIKLLGALDVLHQQRPPLIHGDIDPGNIYLDADGEPRLVDFATARLAALDARRLARSMATGALDYVPFEQLIGQSYPSSDLYALGVSYLAAVTRTPPEEMPHDHIRIDVRALATGTLAEAELVWMEQVTAPDPSDRMQSAALLRERVQLGASRPERDSEPTASTFGLPWDSKGSDNAELDWTAAHEEVLLELALEAADYRHELERGGGLAMPPEPTMLERVHAFGINDDGTLAVFAHAHDAIIVDTATMKIRGELSFGENASRIAISRDGKRVAILTGFEDLLLYDVGMTTWLKHEITVEGMWPGNSQLVFSPDGERVAISDDDQVNIYEWTSGRLVKRHDVDGQFGLVYAPDSSALFASGASHTTLLAEHDSAESYRKLDVDAVAFSMDGAQVAVVRDGVVSVGGVPADLWRIETLEHQITVSKERRRLNILRFSPDMRHLVVTGKTGLMRMIHLGNRTVQPWQDARAEDTSGVKVFGAGFVGDDRRVWVHGTFSPDQFGAERLGGVYGFDVSDGAYLGALIWRDRMPSVQSARGFVGALADARSPGFGGSLWERADLALAEFNGRDVEADLSSAQRASLRDFAGRYRALVQLDEAIDEVFPIRDMMEETAGYGAVLLSIFQEAAKRHEEDHRKDNSGTSFGDRSFTGHVLSVARDVQALRADEIDDRYEAQLDRGVTAPIAKYAPVRVANVVADIEPNTPRQTPPEDRRRESPRREQVPTPTRAPDLAEPPEDPRARSIRRNRRAIQALVLGTSVGYGLTLPLLILKKLPAEIMVLALLVLAPIASLFIALTLGRAIYR